MKKCISCQYYAKHNCYFNPPQIYPNHIRIHHDITIGGSEVTSHQRNYVTLRPEVHAHTPACQHHSLRKSTPEETQLLATNISDFEFTTRTTHVLLSHNINTVCNLVQYTPKELIKLDNFGKKSLQEVIDVLRFEGLTLRGETQ